MFIKTWRNVFGKDWDDDKLDEWIYTFLHAEYIEFSRNSW